jgi:hypothetical protein
LRVVVKFIAETIQLSRKKIARRWPKRGRAEIRACAKISRVHGSQNRCAWMRRRLTQTPYNFADELQLTFDRAHHDFHAAIRALLFD